MKILKKIIIVIVLLILAQLIIRGWHLTTGGFRLDKIDPSFSLEESAVNESYKEILPILEQKFKYIGKGCQVYVFASEDDKYVIKFICHYKYKTPFWNYFLDFHPKLQSLKKEKYNRAFQKKKIGFCIK